MTTTDQLTRPEGYHNYHHTFPWDYSTSEFGWKFNFNFTTLLIDMFAFMGLVYERKTVNKDLLSQRVSRTGDGSWSPALNSVVHWALGIASSTWILWFSLILRCIFIK